METEIFIDRVHNVIEIEIFSFLLYGREMTEIDLLFPSGIDVLCPSGILVLVRIPLILYTQPESLSFWSISNLVRPSLVFFFSSP